MDAAVKPPTSLQSATFQIVPHTSSSKLIVFFSATGAKPGRFDYWNYGNKLECHRIFINNGPSEWYQAGVPGFGSSIDETVVTIKNWAKYLGASEIYTTGASMGGYASILYGILLDA